MHITVHLNSQQFLTENMFYNGKLHIYFNTCNANDIKFITCAITDKRPTTAINNATSSAEKPMI